MWPKPQHPRAPVGDFPPRWASAWGDDAYGLWADMAVQGGQGQSIVQRLRWIEPTLDEGFWMGSTANERKAIAHKDVRFWANQHESEPRRVPVALGYWLADTPCTQALWQAVMGDNNPSHFQSGADAPRRPVEQVAYEGGQGQDVQTFLQRLQAQLPQGVKAGLPSEAEWEYACRAGTPTAYWWGDNFDATKANANATEDKRWDAEKGTTPVDRYAPNPWGLYDMHGNVWEWTCSPWRRRLDDSNAVEDRGARVVRGGSWFSHVGFARAAYRDRWRLDGRGRDLGFRLLLRSSGPGPEGLAQV